MGTLSETPPASHRTAGRHALAETAWRGAGVEVEGGKGKGKKTKLCIHHEAPPTPPLPVCVYDLLDLRFISTDDRLTERVTVQALRLFIVKACMKNHI
jgi:hypothetical protein